MTRREWLVNWARLVILRWRMVRGRALPALGVAALRWLDTVAARDARKGQ